MNTLHEVFERRASEVGSPELDLDLLVGLGEARLRRRRRTGAAGGAIAVAAAVAVGVVLAGGQHHDTIQQPSGPPTQISPPTSRLVPVMRPSRTNEFVLQYSDPAAADRALVDAVQQLRQCPKPPGHGAFVRDYLGPINRDPKQFTSVADGPADANWGTERIKWPTSKAHGRIPSSEYAFHIARADNVLIVIETTGTDDRGGTILTRAVTTALPHYRYGITVPGGEAIAAQPYMVQGFFHEVPEQGWPPRLISCVDPQTWGADKAEGATFIANANSGQ